MFQPQPQPPSLRRFRYFNDDDDHNTRAIKREEIVVDPDGDSSSLCSACKIPIFSTASISFSHGDEQLFMHDQCATMPENLLHELHPDHTLVRLDRFHLPTPIAASNCSNCNEVCGTLFYQCPSSECDFRLDLLCVSQIKIMHRSHHHTMITIRLKGSSSLICCACDNQHHSSSELQSATLSYLCNFCGYWIHPDCASLPNAILHFEYHHHSLFLTYNLPNDAYSLCEICHKDVKNTSGGYICPKCPDYVIHMRCALTRPEKFKPVFIRDAEVSDLARLPMPDEDTSLIPYLVGSNEDTSLIRYINRNSSVDDNDDDDDDDVLVHQHPLTLHEIDDGDQPISGACNACIQFVSPPFLSCSECPDFFIHRSCANLPDEIKHPAHEHTLYYILKPPESDISGAFSCKGCGFRCNGFAYICGLFEDYSMDVFCAFINPAITHDSHKKTHILFMSRNINFDSDQICNCCSSTLSGIFYECNICSNFKLHARCAMLPNTVRHSFDNHTLNLITTGARKKIDIATSDDDDDICEVCEEHIEKKHWHYGCEECDQLFHIDCIPSVDRLSRIKLGSTISVDGHACALTLVRENKAVCWGRPCGVCGEILKSSNNGLAYECSNCFFGIHHKCAKKCLLKS